ncbi:MAG TPA: response regulator [Candidatus Limnocylindria bacterium]
MTRVLVIDDDVSNSELMRVVLEDASFAVVTAHKANDLPSERFDCVVTDLVTVGAYTFEDARDWVLSLRERYPSVPMIIATAHPEARADADRLGVRVIVKPFEIDTLAQAVREITS